MQRTHWLVITIMALVVYACAKENRENIFKGFDVPAGFPAPVYHFETNRITEAGFELGKKLFYDTRLSADNTISCGSCHIQTSAFTHHGHSLSHGIADRVGTRNSPPIMNFAWSKEFMWDGGVFDLDLQAIAPITNHVEMGETMEGVLSKLRAAPEYPALFQKAFGSPEITTSTFLKSISQFMLMCISSNSKYDSVKRHDPGVVFSPDESKGYELFVQKCGSCHKEPLFTDHSFRNNGISVTADEGRYLVTQQDADRFRFKVPSLRNLDYTAPYMHDGRFLTLDAVLDHYSGGMEKTPNLDQAFLSANRPGISMTASEKKLIKTFLQTLNDKSFVLNKSLSEP